ncbi:YqaE/Pmp3 family membrane protein [Sphingomonas sp. 28-63-12]|uniref:YqaE/Pmp3 family membrane protein n=1 Tax=Sphingomonas sp. 28-63-12 TaxID=1970434 RepID=UPI0035A8667D
MTPSRSPGFATLLAAALMPPLGVYRAFGPGRDFAIACGMTLAGFLPGMGFALIRVLAPRPVAASAPAAAAPIPA